MNAKKLLALLLAMVMMLTMLPAVADVISVQVNPAPAAEEPAAADPTAIIVNGEEIAVSVVDGYYTSFYDYYTSEGYTLSEDNLIELRQMAGTYAVQLTVMRQKGFELGLLPLSDEVIAALTEENHTTWEDTVAYGMQVMAGITDESSEEEVANARIATLAFLESRGFTEASELENRIEAENFSVIHDYAIKDTVVSDEEILATFNAKVAADQETYGSDIYTYEFYTQYYGVESYYTPEGYRGIIQILLPVDEALLTALTDAQTALESAGEDADKDALQAAVDAAREAALASIQPTYDEIVAKFNAGTSFQDLIAEYNTDPGMTDPTILANGYMVHKDSVLWDPSFTAAAMSLEAVGQMSQPSLGSFGAYIVYYLRDVPAGAIELTDALKEELYAAALPEKQEAQFDAAMTSWLDVSKIVYTEAGQPYQKTAE